MCCYYNYYYYYYRGIGMFYRGYEERVYVFLRRTGTDWRCGAIPLDMHPLPQRSQPSRALLWARGGH